MHIDRETGKAIIALFVIVGIVVGAYLAAQAWQSSSGPVGWIWKFK